MKKNIIRMNEVRMFKKTQETLTVNQLIVNQMPGLKSSSDAFELIVQAIEVKNKGIERTTQGITESKQTARKEMETKAQMIANRAMAYASTSKNSDVYTTMSKLISKIGTANDELCFTRCDNVADVAEKVLPALVGWNVTQDDIEELREKCAAFIALQTTASVIEEQINTAIKVVNGLIKDGKALLSKTIDKAVKSMKKDEFSFVSDYFAARRVQNLGHRYTQFKGVAVSGLTQDELRDVEIQFRNGTETFTAKTDENGKYMERLNPDVYDIIASHPLYESFVIEGKRIEPGEIIVENFELKAKA